MVQYVIRQELQPLSESLLSPMFEKDVGILLIDPNGLRDIDTCDMVSRRSNGKMGRLVYHSWRKLSALIISLSVTSSVSFAADPPCDKYSLAKQSRCAEIWKDLNKEDGPIIAQFGLDQQKRREEGKINAQQHLAENMIFIKQSTEKRIERLKERMAKE